MQRSVASAPILCSIISYSVSPLPGVLASQLWLTKCTMLCACRGMKKSPPAGTGTKVEFPSEGVRVYVLVFSVFPVYHGPLMDR